MNQQDFAQQQIGTIGNLYNQYASPDWMNRQMQLLQQLYGVQARNLFGQEQRSMTNAGNQGAAQAASMNLSNPNTLMNRGIGNVGQQYAGAYGGLAEGLAGQQSRLPMEQFGILNSLLGLGSQYGQMLPQPSNLGAMLGSLLGTGIGAFGGGYGAALGQRMGGGLGSQLG